MNMSVNLLCAHASSHICRDSRTNVHLYICENATEMMTGHENCHVCVGLTKHIIIEKIAAGVFLVCYDVDSMSYPSMPTQVCTYDA